MAEVDYEELAASIPEEWYDKEDLQKAVKTVFTKLVDGIAERLNKKIESDDDLEDFYQAISAKSGETVEKIEENFVSDSSFFGRLELFEEKYSQIVDQLPKNKQGNPSYPMPILAKVLNTDQKLAAEMSTFYFGDENPIDKKEMIH